MGNWGEDMDFFFENAYIKLPKENDLPEGMKLAYLPSLERLRLRLSIRGTERQKLEKLIDIEELKLNKYIGNAIFGNGDQNMEIFVLIFGLYQTCEVTKCSL